MDYRELPEEFLEKNGKNFGEEYPEHSFRMRKSRVQRAARQHGQADTGTVFRDGTDGGLEFETSAVDEERVFIIRRTPIQASVILRGTLLFAGTECDVSKRRYSLLIKPERPGSGFVRGTGR